jgi:hypothetical protein
MRALCSSTAMMALLLGATACRRLDVDARLPAVVGTSDANVPPSAARTDSLARVSLHVPIGARATLVVDLQTVAGVLGATMFGIGLRVAVALP